MTNIYFFFLDAQRDLQGFRNRSKLFLVCRTFERSLTLKQKYIHENQTKPNNKNIYNTRNFIRLSIYVIVKCEKVFAGIFTLFSSIFTPNLVTCENTLILNKLLYRTVVAR